ncbi:MAG: hypothetical protein HUJ68_06865 [Clostridia bacterium]|nr:hypothetical protein [Clostridia bacterium]
MGGNMPESSFNRLSIEASAYIKRNTHNRINENNIPDEVKLCTCSLADKMKKYEKKKGKVSESVGSWSVNYQNNSEDENELYDVLVNFLLYVKDEKGESVLYRGC